MLSAVYHALCELIYNLTPGFVIDFFFVTQQDPISYILESLYDQIGNDNILLKKNLNPFSSSPNITIIKGDIHNIYQVTSYGEGNRFDKSARKPLDIIKHMAGTENIINLNSHDSVTERNNIKPFLSNENAIRSVFLLSKKLFEKAISEWTDTISIQDKMSYVVCNLVGQCVLGLDEISMQDAQLVRQAGIEIAKGDINSLNYQKLCNNMTELNQRLLRQHRHKILTTENYTKTKAAITDNDNENDIDEKLEKGKAISNLLVEANLSTLIVGGLNEVHKSQEIKTKLMQTLSEIDENNLSDVRKAKYLDCIFKESLRFMSPTPYIVRQTSEPTTLNIKNQSGENRLYSIPSNTLLFAPIRRIHHDAKYWDQPNKFIPERFDDGVRKQYFAPFSVGQRSCPTQSHFTEVAFKAVMLSSLKYEFVIDKESYAIATNDMNHTNEMTLRR